MTSIFPLASPYPPEQNQYLSTLNSTPTLDPQAIYTNTYPDAFTLISHQQRTSPTTLYPASTDPAAPPNFPTSHPNLLPLQVGSDFLKDSTTLRSASAQLPAFARPMYARPFNSMGGPVIHNNRGIKRQRDHERTPSASTIASNGPASPYMQNSSHPLVANTDTSPNSPAYHPDPSFGKNFPAQTTLSNEFLSTGFAPDQFAQLSGANPGAHLAMKDFGIQHHLDSDYSNDFAPSRQSMSSYDNDSPATSHSGGIEADMQAQNGQANDVRQVNPHVQFQRTESQAFKDELYMPQNYNMAPASVPKPTSQNNYLSPHRNLMAERLQTANLTRSASPKSVSRERSPFRDGSPLAPAREWTSAGAVGTAARMRQEQKEANAQAELARQAPALQREPTKTISPKDALLDYHESDQVPLFQDSVPIGYDTHKGGTEQWPANYHSFGGLPVGGQQHMNFRHTNGVEAGFTGSGFDLQLPQGADQIQNNPFQQSYSSTVPAKMNSPFDNPEFSPSMPSMETSVSDIGPGLSSQEESSTPAIQRPDDTRANTGTYTCTYHDCTQRFDSHNNLKKHKQEVHFQKQRQMTSTSPSAEGSVSPRSTGSPALSTSGMSSAAILARNSQAGPHKCTRINPSTNKPCNTIFSRPYDLTRHEDTIHNNRKQKVRCQYCREEKTFSRNDALTRHMRVVHPDVTEPQGRRGRRAD